MQIVCKRVMPRIGRVWLGVTRWVRSVLDRLDGLVVRVLGDKEV